LAGAADEQRHGTAVLAANVDFALEKKDHVLGRSTLLEENVAGVGHVFLAVASDPEAVFDGKAVQGNDSVEGGRDFFNGRGTGRRGEEGRSHPGTSGVQNQDSRFWERDSRMADDDGYVWSWELLDDPTMKAPSAHR
jgi:hypothetical protein